MYRLNGRTHEALWDAGSAPLAVDPWAGVLRRLRRAALRHALWRARDASIVARFVLATISVSVEREGGWCVKPATRHPRSTVAAAYTYKL